MPSFSFWLFDVLEVTQKKRLRFFLSSEPNCVLWGGRGHGGRMGGGTTYRKEHQIGQTFWTQVVLIKKCCLKPFEKLEFLQRQDRTYPKFELFVQLWSQFTPWRWWKSKIAIRLSKSIKMEALSPLNFQWEP